MMNRARRAYVMMNRAWRAKKETLEDLRAPAFLDFGFTRKARSLVSLIPSAEACCLQGVLPAASQKAQSFAVRDQSKFTTITGAVPNDVFQSTGQLC